MMTRPRRNLTGMAFFKTPAGLTVYSPTRHPPLCFSAARDLTLIVKLTATESRAAEKQKAKIKRAAIL
jgi:hypothetical protein